MDERDYAIPARLCVGVVLTTDHDVMRPRLRALCTALEKATGISVEPRGFEHYQSLLDALEGSMVDFAWLPPLLALQATVREQAVPIALPVRNGGSVYWAALFTRRDSAVRRLEDLHQLRAAWVDRESAAGFLIIRAFLRKQGIDLAEAFTEEMFLGTHDAVATAVTEGKADVGATFAYFDESTDSDDALLVSAGWGVADVRLVARAGPIPCDVIAARCGLPAMVQRLVQSALVDVQNAELRESARALLGAEGFVAPQAEHLEPLNALLEGLPSDVPPAPSLVPPR